MTSASKETVTRVRRLLDCLVSSQRLSNDDKEVVYDEVAAEARTLSRFGILDTLDKAIGQSKRRRQEAVYLLSHWPDAPEVIVRIGEWLTDPDAGARAALIQTIGNSGLSALAPRLNDIIEHDPDQFCRESAVCAAGRLRAPECLPALLRVAETFDEYNRWRIASSLSRIGREECRAQLTKWFSDLSQPKGTRIFCAWGLAKLCDQEAVKYLVEMLDDPDERGPTFFEPGESIRAAQALADVFGWPFEWHKSSVARVKNQVAEMKENRIGRFL
jgi:hypothetical protein